MSRIARKPVEVPAGVEVVKTDNVINIKGPKGKFEYTLHQAVIVEIEGSQIFVKPVASHEQSRAMVGTTRVLLGNFVTGVTTGFERKLQLVGVGYRAKAQGTKLELNLGYSHPITYHAPEGISFETPSATEILVKGACKQKVGQVAAEIRRLRPPEPYKGKGIRYADEVLILKETKKK